MIAELRLWQLLWLTAVYRWRPLALKVCLCTPPLLALLFAGVLVRATGDLVAPLWLATRGALATLALMLTVPFLFRSPQLFSAVSATLVPGLRKRLIRMAVLCWLIACCVPALILHLSLFDRWLLMLGIAFFLSGLCVARSRSVVGGTLLMQVAPQLMINRKLVAELAGASSLGALATLACATLLALLSVVAATRRMYPVHGEGRAKLRAVLELRAQQDGMAQRPRQPGWHDPSWRFYAHALRKEAVRGAAPVRLLQHGLSPATHWILVLWPMLFVVCGALIVKAFVRMIDVDVLTALVAQLSWMPLSMLLWTQAISNRGDLPGFLLAAREEQSLLRLAPAFGAGLALNGQVASLLLRGAAVNWALRALTVLGVSAFLGASAATLLAASCACALALPWMALPLQRVSRAAAASHSPLGVLWTLPALALTMLMVSEAGLRVVALVWPFVVLVGVLLTLGLCRYWLSGFRTSRAVLPGG